MPRITAAVRTGDTPQRERAAMLRTPPHILVTTPESLYLLLTAERSREMLRTARTVIVDEIHAVIGTRRGAHLALTLERLQQVVTGRCCGSACRRRRSRSRRSRGFWSGRAAWTSRATPPAPSSTKATGAQMDLALEMPRSPLEAVMSHEVWEEYYDRLTRAHRGASHDARVRQHAPHGRAARAPAERAARRRRGHRASRQPVEGEAPRRRMRGSRPGSSRRSSPPRRSSSASTSARSIWSARSDRRTALRRFCSASADPGTPCPDCPKGGCSRSRATT